MANIRQGRPLEQYQLGAKAGAAWRKRTGGDALVAAFAAGESHWRAMDRGKSLATDAPDYGLGFLESALTPAK